MLIAPTAPVCGICFDEPPPPGLRALSCGHGFCSPCWGQTLSYALERGPACVHDTCPAPGCKVPISAEIWAETLPPVGAARLKLLSLRTFVSANSLLCWCPGSRCGRAAALVTPDAPPQLACACSRAYCVLCGEEPHWPASCERRAAWVDLVHLSPDAQAIRQLTRPCPSCGVRTERSVGCMHITCTQCSTEWCWGCGRAGKGVHHVHECSRAPDPSWKFEAEERKLLDGSFAQHFDEWLYRNEQIELVHAGVQAGVQAGAQAGAQAPPAELGLPPSAMTPAALRPMLLRSLSLLRWSQVYLYYLPNLPDALPPRTRAALADVGACTDMLYAACGFGGREADPQRLASPEAAARAAWLVLCLLFLQCTWVPGPPGPVAQPQPQPAAAAAANAVK